MYVSPVLGLVAMYSSPSSLPQLATKVLVAGSSTHCAFAVSIATNEITRKKSFFMFYCIEVNNYLITFFMMVLPESVIPFTI